MSLITPDKIRSLQRKLYCKAIVCLAVKSVGKPDAGNRHVRFDERGGKTEPRRGPRHRHLAKAAGNSYSPSPNAIASLLDSTQADLSHSAPPAGVINCPYTPTPDDGRLGR